MTTRNVLEQLHGAAAAVHGTIVADQLLRELEQRYRLPQPADVLAQLLLREHWRSLYGEVGTWDIQALETGFNPWEYEKSENLPRRAIL